MEEGFIITTSTRIALLNASLLDYPFKWLQQPGLPRVCPICGSTTFSLSLSPGCIYPYSWKSRASPDQRINSTNLSSVMRLTARAGSLHIVGFVWSRLMPNRTHGCDSDRLLDFSSNNYHYAVSLSLADESTPPAHSKQWCGWGDVHVQCRNGKGETSGYELMMTLSGGKQNTHAAGATAVAVAVAELQRNGTQTWVSV